MSAAPLTKMSTPPCASVTCSTSRARRCRIRDVERGAAHGQTVGGEPGAGLFGLVAVEVGEDDGGSRFGQGPSEHGADATPTTGDDRDAVLQLGAHGRQDIWIAHEGFGSSSMPAGTGVPSPTWFGSTTSTSASSPGAPTTRPRSSSTSATASCRDPRNANAKWFEASDGSQVHLSEDPEHRPADRAHVAVVLGDELDEVVERLRTHGTDAEIGGFGDVRVAICLDPAGNRWELRDS